MHENQAHLTKNRAPMIRYHSHRQLSLAEFDWPFQTALDENNRWVKMSHCLPWDALAEGYYQSLSLTQGRPSKDARLVIVTTCWTSKKSAKRSSNSCANGP